MQKKIFLLTPPFTQMNTPYPATAYLKGFFNTLNVDSNQADFGIEVILAIFSRNGLEEMFFEIEENDFELSENGYRIFLQKQLYLNTINKVIKFLQNGDPTLAHRICQRNYLPEGKRFDVVGDTDWAFGNMGIQDKARYFATLYLEDINDLITETIDPYFGFSRYAERLGLSAHSFDELYDSLNEANTFVDNILCSLLEERIEEYNPDLVAISLPFPGNLYSGFKCAQFIKSNFPDVKIVMGGGYPNTELRSLKEKRVFEFVDFITLDDGEAPLKCILENIEGKRDINKLKRAFILNDNIVTYIDDSDMNDIAQCDVGVPDYSDLPLKKYLSVIETANPMNRLWNDGRWTKMTMAHGCYWGKCTFCDVTLDYVKSYDANSAKDLVDRVEILIEQTGQTGFHFVDEAAPPKLMRDFAIEVLRRELTITWWTNIRFEKSFTEDLCELLSLSGCIAVSGGLEVASDRLLKLIDKGVSIDQMAKVASNFTAYGIMVHAYLMYGFPTQNDQETIDSLEVVRQLFKNGIVQSAFWHQFAMTEHSPVGLGPEVFNVKSLETAKGDFANNDLQHSDPLGTDHQKYSYGLKKSLYNFMHGSCFDFDLQEWFDFNVPNTTIDPFRIEKARSNYNYPKISPSKIIVWTGILPEIIEFDSKVWALSLLTKVQGLVEIYGDEETIIWTLEMLFKFDVANEKRFTFKTIKSDYELAGFDDFDDYWNGEIINDLREFGLLVL